MVWGNVTLQTPQGFAKYCWDQASHEKWSRENHGELLQAPGEPQGAAPATWSAKLTQLQTGATDPGRNLLSLWQTQLSDHQSQFLQASVVS